MAFFFGFGYDKEGYDKKGFNKQGYNRTGYDKEGYNEVGYNAEGYDRLGFDADGFSKSGFNKEGYDRDGYNRRGFNKDGFDRKGYDKDGYNRFGVDKYGYPRRSSSNEYNHDDTRKKESTKQTFSKRPINAGKKIKDVGIILAGIALLLIMVAPLGMLVLWYFTILDVKGYNILTLSPAIIIVACAVYCFNSKMEDKRYQKEKAAALERERKVIQEMYATGKTDSDVAEYLDKLTKRRYFLGQDLIWCLYNPYYNWSLGDCERYFANQDERQDAIQWRIKIREKYPQAYQNHDHEIKASEFRHRVVCYVVSMQEQSTIAKHSISNTSNNIDWEKAAIGTMIFGPTGVALGMMDDEDKN